jgi:hypothetical protein
MKGCLTKAYTKHAEYGAVLQDSETCLIGFGYINTNVDILKQAQFAGTVITVNKEEGITVKLDAIEGAERGKKSDSGNKGMLNFHIPASIDVCLSPLKGIIRMLNTMLISKTLTTL